MIISFWNFRFGSFIHIDIGTIYESFYPNKHSPPSPPPPPPALYITNSKLVIRLNQAWKPFAFGEKKVRPIDRKRTCVSRHLSIFFLFAPKISTIVETSDHNRNWSCVPKTIDDNNIRHLWVCVCVCVFISTLTITYPIIIIVSVNLFHWWWWGVIEWVVAEKKTAH